MSRKLFFLGISSLVLAPGAALSLGLGEIRLDSYLNQPMDAEIALNLSSPDELDTLRVELAPPEAFERVGLDRPAYLNDLRFAVRASGPTGALVEVSSTRPITEPFVTFLIEARWSGGRALREYTVLLDPPIFLPAPPVETAPAPAPVAAPAPAPTVDAPQAAPAPVTRPAPQPAPVAAPTPARSDYGSEFGPVQRNDTLWRIAQEVRPDDSLTTNQVMVALYRENPRAFDGNINRLRAGAILRVPSREQMAATPTREANAEVRRQTEEWRGAAPPPVERRLELAPPAETASAPAPASDTPRRPAAPDTELLDAVEALRSDLAETRRLMEVKDAEIAALQARLAELESGDVSVPPAGAPAPAPAEVTPEAAAPAPAVEPAPEVKAEAPAPAAPAPAPPPPAPTLMDRIFALLGSLWLWVVLAIVLVAAAVGVFLRRRKEDDNSIEQDLAATGSWGALDDSDGKLAEATGSAPAPRRTAAVAAGAAAATTGSLESVLAQEAGPAQRETPPPKSAPEAAPAAAPRGTQGEEEYEYPFEDTIAGETGIYLDQTDAMTEADFHMAYGLYDQAAEIVRKAIDREPDQYDLRRKLLEICFVWGNAEEFAAQARAIRELDDPRVEAEWAKIAIMGRQVCPGEAMFETAPAGEVDMDLGSGEAGASEEDWLDFDIGEASIVESGEEAPLPGDTRELPTLPPEAVATEPTAEINLEDLDMDLDLGLSGEHALRDLAERAPEFADDAGEDEAEAEAEPPPAYVPAEDEDEDEDEDHGGTMVLDTAAMRRASEEPTQRGEGWEMAEDEPTVAGLGGFEEDEDDAEADQTLIKQVQPSYEAPTTQVGGFEEEDDADLDLGELTQSLKADLDLGAEQPDAPEGERAAEHSLGDTAEMMPAEPFPDEILEIGDTAEMPPGDAGGEFNEVGTKLDLARAYIDMGDPEGARSILGEVVEEGNEAQRDEARELLASLD